jgi:hypothetical protein
MNMQGRASKSSLTYLECDDADYDTQEEEYESDDKPDHAPHLKWQGSANQHLQLLVKGVVVAGVPCEGKQPQIFANADASDAFILRAIVSSTNG